MKFGDKVMVTYKNGDQFVGRIKDETEKMWIIEFDDNDTRKIRKTMQVEIVDDPKTPENEIPSVPRKSKIWTYIAIFLVIATALTVAGIILM